MDICCDLMSSEPFVQATISVMLVKNDNRQFDSSKVTARDNVLDTEHLCEI